MEQGDISEPIAEQKTPERTYTNLIYRFNKKFQLK